MRTSTRAMLALFFLLGLAACSIGPREQSTPRTYLLNPPIKVSAANHARTDAATLAVSLPNAQPGFDTPRMVYLLRPHELGYYALNQWADTPARMLRSLLVESMERTGLWRAVVEAPSAVRADYRLDCDNLILEQQFFSPSRVRLALRAQLIDARRQVVVDARDFEFFENAPSEDAYGGVIAANNAAARMIEQLAQWLSAAMEDNPRSVKPETP